MNYRAAGRARSHREFTAKIGVVTEEADETLGWLELIGRLELSRGAEIVWLLEESRELVAIFGSSYATAKEKDAQSRRGIREAGSTRRPQSPITRSPLRRFD
jgi:hypothetical protein